MSTTKLFKAGIIATVGVAGLTLAANAQSRYGNVYDYESGRNCGNACTPAPVAAPTTSRYGAPVVAAPTYNPAPVYVDCVTAGTCAPQPSVVYSQPAPVYTQPAPVYTQPAPTFTQSTQSFTQSAAPVSCPSGTTAQADGTCLQSSSGFSTTTTFSEPSFSSSTSSSTFSSPSTSFEPVNCPSGTIAQGDGTCMQTGSTFSSGSSFSTGSTYSEPSYSSGSTFSSSSNLGPVNCPAGTIAQGDGTCMQSGSNAYTGSSIELYTGDATTTSSSGSYGSSSTYSSPDYLPIRK